MSSSDYLNPHQLKLFMTGMELKNSITYSGDRNDDETLDDMWNRKVEESKETRGVHGAGTYESIREHGWKPEGRYDDKQIPVRYSKSKSSMRIANGHHRVAAAADIEEKTGKLTFFPLSHYDDPFVHRSIPIRERYSSKWGRYMGQ